MVPPSGGTVPLTLSITAFRLSIMLMGVGSTEEDKMTISLSMLVITSKILALREGVY